jgi:hypothetical protein
MGYLICSNLISSLISHSINQDVAKFPVGYNVYVGSNIYSQGAWNIEDSVTLGTLMTNSNKSPQEIHNTLLKEAKNRVASRSLSSNLEHLINKQFLLWGLDSDAFDYAKHGNNPANPSKIDLVKYEKNIRLILELYYLGLLCLCIFSAILILFKKQKDVFGFQIFFALIILGIASVHLIVEVAGRYHFPAISIMSILGSYTICSLNEKLN